MTYEITEKGNTSLLSMYGLLLYMDELAKSL